MLKENKRMNLPLSKPNVELKNLKYNGLIEWRKCCQENCSEKSRVHTTDCHSSCWRCFEACSRQRSKNSELQATPRRAVDAGRHSVVREAEYPQQTAARVAGSSARFAATTSSETQDQASDRRQSNASDQRRFRETRQTSKADYFDGFDASIHGPLHVQPFVAQHM